MLDTTTAIAAATAWTTTLTPGDVVLFPFPCAEDDGAGKVRPCLVLEVGRVGAHEFAEIAYGTSALTTANRGYEIHIRTAAGMAAAGLDKPTRFVGARRVRVSLAHPGFRTNAAHASPVIGRLEAAGIERMNDVRGRLWAERDIAAERRRERYGRTEQGVPVVWRSSHRPNRPAAPLAQANTGGAR